ncbi:hypothetical protein ABH931_002012 [Streptacidiphilus sp. MAP12-33]|uniref:hypothetical protein n=1 Tax=Streptacidiphilus sp. MAP12-33 TaxID=3156266 RepID=UPI0035125B6D
MQPTDGVASAPSRLVLPDGRVLSSPLLATARALVVGDWVFTGGRPAQIVDLRSRHDGGRVVHLRGRPPLRLSIRDQLAVYQYVSG